MAYLWSRTVPCPSCHAEMPLIRQYWLARKDKKKVALEPVLDQENHRVDFRVVEGPGVTGNPAEATTSRGDTKCLLCGQVVKAAQIHDFGRAGEISARPTAVVLEASGKGGKRYRTPTEADLTTFASAEAKAKQLSTVLLNDMPAIPDEPLAYHPQYMLVREYGLDEWGKLFNARQLLALTTFARLVEEAHAEMLLSGMDVEYSKAVTTYLGLLVDKIAIRGSTLSVFHPGRGTVENAMGRQALPMVWDYAEASPIGEGSGAASQSLGFLARSLSED